MMYTLLTLHRTLTWDLFESTFVSGRERDIAAREVRKDLANTAERAREEGFSLFTKTYPLISKHLLRCIEGGVFSPFPGLKTKKGSLLPCFMHGWWCRLFSSRTGSMLSDFDPHVLRAMRQLLTFASKAKCLPTEAACNKAYKTFKEDDYEIQNQSLWSTSYSTFGPSSDTASLYFTVERHWCTKSDIGRLFVQVARTIGSEFDKRYPDGISLAELRPKHGPGAVAERYDNDGKWSDLLDHKPGSHNVVFPTSDFYSPSFGTTTAAEPHFSWAPESRLLSVPKTALTPRLIAAEPASHMFWQQSLLSGFNSVLESTYLGQSINISDQSVSQERARLSSCDLSLGTIDLSKASDTVTLDHLGSLFPGDSGLLAQILACRTNVCEIPDIGSIRLRKFATMGSALCFPIESLVFLAAVAASIIRQSGKRVTNARVRDVTQECTVYGDDIIAPTKYIKGILLDLVTLGFLPNKDKSYYKSHFRESCGGDFWRGIPVKPVYLRQDVWSRKWLTDNDVISLISFSRQCQTSGLYKTAKLALQLVESKRKVTIPYSEDEKSYLSHNIPDRQRDVQSFICRDLHVKMVKALSIVPETNPCQLDGYARLFRNLANAEFFPVDLLKEVVQDPKLTPTRRITLEPKWVAA